MLSVVLTEKAESDLDSIHEYYQGVLGADAALEVIADFFDDFKQLGQFPGSGRPSVVPDVRELVMGEYPFIVPYRVMQGRVQILRVLHQRSERSNSW